MRLYRLRSRTGFCIYSEQGRDCGKFINDLRNSPLKFFGLSVRGERLYGYVGSGDYKYLCRLAEEHKLVCEKIDEKGAAKSFRPFKHRIGLVIGFFLSVGIVAFLSDRVMIIEIGGNENIPDERIMSHLEDTGIFIGSRISSVNLRRAEKQIAAMDKDIDWVGIKHIGSRVTVEINEMTSPPEMERKNTPCNIISSHDARITGVKVYSGMLIPMVGDGVKKGDVLISGVVDTKYGRSFYVHSIGEITGVYTEKMTFSEKYVTEEKVCTGETCAKALKIFGHKLTYSPAELPEGDYEYSETEERVTFLGIALPVYQITGHYRLTENRSITISKEQAEQNIAKRAEKFEKNFLDGNMTVKSRDIEKKYDKNGVTFTYTYTVEGEIGEEKMLFAKYEKFGGQVTEEQKKELN